MPKTVAIFIFDEVEVLDFAGPYEVFAVTGAQTQAFEVFTVAETDQPVRARNGLMVLPTHSFATAPRADIIVVPGGYGTRPLLQNERVIDWVRKMDQEAQLTLSVCTGSLLLGRAGLLDGLTATTHHLAFEELRKCAPNSEIREGARLVDNGRIVTSAGVSAGIDMSFHIVARELGQEAAEKIARYIEYPWPRAGMDQGPTS